MIRTTPTCAWKGHDFDVLNDLNDEDMIWQEEHPSHSKYVYLTGYKADYMGYEALAEVIVSRLLAHSNAADLVTYDPVLLHYDDKDVAGCISRDFMRKGEMLIPFERLHRAYEGRGLAQALAAFDPPKDRIVYTVDFIERVTNLTDVGKYLTAILELDCLTLNEDRHTNDLAVLRYEETKEFRLCPIFDNGLSLLSDLNDYPLTDDLYTCIERVKAKPFDRDHAEQMAAA